MRPHRKLGEDAENPRYILAKAMMVYRMVADALEEDGKRGARGFCWGQRLLNPLGGFTRLKEIPPLRQRGRDCSDKLGGEQSTTPRPGT